MDAGVTLFLEEKFQRGVLLRVPINNNNYEEPMGLFVIIRAKKKLRESLWCNLMAQSRPDSCDLY